MEFLTKPVQVDTGKVTINLRLLLNERQKNILIMVTDGEDTKRKTLTAYPYHYSNFSKEEPKIKEYIIRSLEKDYIKHTPQDVETLLNYLKSDMVNKVKASVNFPDTKERPNFYDIFINCQNDNRTNSEANINDVKENGRATTPTAIIRETLITKYQDVIDKINNGETKELVLDCKDFDITVNTKDGRQYPLTDRLQHSPTKFIELVQKELNNLIHERPPSKNPYEIKEDNSLYYLRFKNLEETPLKYMLSGQVGRFTQTQGVIQGVYELRPKLKTGVFECRGCMRLHEEEQDLASNEILVPSLCSGCGGRNFRLMKDLSTYTNERLVLITEPPEDLDLETQPRQLLGQLVGNKDFVNKVNAGNRVKLTGVLGSIEDKDKNRFFYDVNHLEKLEDKTITLTPEEKRYFLKLSQRPDILDILVNSFAPELILPRELKESILLYLVKSGENDKGLDMIHILIISDPATAKSKLKVKTHELTEKGILTSGTGSSGVGLTGAIVKDPIINNWVLKAGAVPLANNGHCIIDEIDKMAKEDTTHLNNLMEEGRDDFNKADVHGTLFGKTSILALGNPKFGRYDRYKSLQDQVEIDPSFQSRFDLIFLIEDKPDKEKDSQIIDSILNEYTQNDKGETTPDIIEDVQKVKRLSTPMLKKYLAFARNEFKPKLTPEVKDQAKKYGLKVRTPQDDNEAPYNFRFIRATPKLAGAYAKLHLRTNINKSDVQKAIHLKEYSMNLIGLDPITNTIDSDRVTGNLNQEDKRERDLILKLIKDHVQDPNNLDGEGIPPNILLENFQYETNKSKNTFYRRLNELKTAGEIAETGKGRNKQYNLK